MPKLEKAYTPILDGLTRNHHKLTPRRNIGDPGELRFISVKSLYIDTRYQREVSSRGHANIRAMIEQFYWSQFQPIVVAQLSDDKQGQSRYAVIDGQHRAHACALHPEIDKVPALVLQVSLEEQAKSFAVINGRVTKVSPLQIYWAGLQGRDEKWMAVARVCALSDVSVFRKKPKGMSHEWPDHHTFAVNSIAKIIEHADEATAIKALKLILQYWGGQPDELKGQSITLMGYFIKNYAPRLDDPRLDALSQKDSVGWLDVPEKGRSRYRLAAKHMARACGLDEVKLLEAAE